MDPRGIPRPLTRVPPEEKTLLSVFESVIAGPRDEELSARDLELVKAILESVRLADGHEVYVAHHPVEVYPSWTQEDWESGKDPLARERVVMATHWLASQGFDRSDEEFVRLSAQWIRDLMGKPFFIYRIVVFPTHGESGNRPWAIRCAGTK